MYRIVFVAAACVGVATHADAQVVLTLEQTMARARQEAGSVLIGRARIAEAEADVLEASVRFRENPLIESDVGTRSAGGARYTDLNIGLLQQFETGGQRRARTMGARAAVEVRRAEAEVAAREAVFAAAGAFLSGVAALERLRVAEQWDTLSRDLLHATERRYAAGDIAAIDLNLARIDAARSVAALRAARAELTTAVGTLKTLLRLPETGPIELRGSLEVRPLPPLQQFHESIGARPDLAVLQAAGLEAAAETELGSALRRPDVGFRVGFSREATDTIVLGGLSVTLPTFQRGQGVLARGVARASRARLELDVARDAALAELETAYSVHQQHATLIEALERDAASGIADNEDLARRSYEAGELNLMELLLIRRDALDTRTVLIDRHHDAAHSRLTVDYVAGVLR
jgi:outer membrane protein, heavy metal efflux system